jgi:hypothetical protein
MGYNTRFAIDIKPEEAWPEVFQALHEVNPNYFGPYDEETEGDVWVSPTGQAWLFDSERVKWYDWKDDITKVSVKLPDALITLDGEGEEAGDQWRAFVKDGTVEVHKAEWIPPSEPDFLKGEK